jgi:hypothetical protein
MYLTAKDIHRLDAALTRAHLKDWLTACGCSKQTLKVCGYCARVVCACSPKCGCGSSELMDYMQEKALHD